MTQTRCKDQVILDLWHPLAALAEVPPGVVSDTVLLEEPVSYAANRDGKADVWRSLRDLPAGTPVEVGTLGNTLPVKIAYGYVWTSLGNPPADLFPIPEFEEADRRKLNAATVGVHVSAPRAIDPNDKEQVKNQGILAMLGKGQNAGLSTIFGTSGLGGDLKGAIGGITGNSVGDAHGFGGLGLKGTGTGGGGSGNTIGVGAVGTKGRGGGMGSFGNGVGGLGKKGDRDVNVATGTAVVMGSIDKELIRKVIQDHAAQIRYCYEQQLAINPKLQGDLSAWFGSVPAVPAACKGNKLLTDEGCNRNGMKEFERIWFWRTPVANCGGGRTCVPYYRWVTDYIAILGGR